MILSVRVDGWGGANVPLWEEQPWRSAHRIDRQITKLFKQVEDGRMQSYNELGLNHTSLGYAACEALPLEVEGSQSCN